MAAAKLFVSDKTHPFVVACLPACRNRPLVLYLSPHSPQSTATGDNDGSLPALAPFEPIKNLSEARTDTKHTPRALPIRPPNGRSHASPDVRTTMDYKMSQQRECMLTCLSELSAAKCDCWPQNKPFRLDDSVMDPNKTMKWCLLERLIEQPNTEDIG